MTAHRALSEAIWGTTDDDDMESADRILTALEDAGWVLVPDADGSESKADALTRALRAVTHEFEPSHGMPTRCRFGPHLMFCLDAPDGPAHQTPERVLGAKAAWVGQASAASEPHGFTFGVRARRWWRCASCGEYPDAVAHKDHATPDAAYATGQTDEGAP